MNPFIGHDLLVSWASLVSRAREVRLVFFAYEAFPLQRYPSSELARLWVERNGGS